MKPEHRGQAFYPYRALDVSLLSMTTEPRGRNPVCMLLVLLALITFAVPCRATDSLEWTEYVKSNRLQIWIAESFVVPGARGSLRYLLPGNKPDKGWAGRVVFSKRTPGRDRSWTVSVNTDGSFGLEGLSAGMYNVWIKLRRRITIRGIAEVSPEADPTARIDIPIPYPGYAKLRVLAAKARRPTSAHWGADYVRVLAAPVVLKAIRGSVVDFGGAVIRAPISC